MIWNSTPSLNSSFTMCRYGPVRPKLKITMNMIIKCSTIGLLYECWIDILIQVSKFDFNDERVNVCQFNCQWNFSLLVYLRISDAIDWLRFAEFDPALYSVASEPDQTDTIQIFLTMAYCSNRFKCLNEFSRHFSIFFSCPSLAITIVKPFSYEYATVSNKSLW